MRVAIDIHNGPNDGEPVLTLARQDGSLVDVYRVADLPAAFQEALGRIPAPPAFCTIVTTTEAVPLSSDTFSQSLNLPSVSVRGDPAYQSLVDAYRAQIDAYNNRATMLSQLIASLWPSLLKRAS